VKGASQLKDTHLQRATGEDASHSPLCISQQLAAYFTKMTQNRSSGTIFSFSILLSSKNLQSEVTEQNSLSIVMLL